MNSRFRGTGRAPYFNRDLSFIFGHLLAMEALERIWEGTGVVFSGMLRAFERSITAMFGSSNARQVRRMASRVQAINDLEEKYKALSNEQLRAQTVLFRERLAKGETLDDLLPEAFAVCREGGRRFLNMRHYDTQLIGGMVLHGGSIAEMVTGEGKTLVATLPAYLNALEGKGVHVVTVNDYLARRDMEWMGPLYMGLGLTVGAIQSDMPVAERQHAYSCDITYGTNNEFGFDYLRDNMRPAARGDESYSKPSQQSQKTPLNFAIIDEVDNILIDEARTPLIISGPADDDVRKYAEADRIARQLTREKHFVVNEKDHTAHLTEEGVREAERMAGVESFYTPGNMEWPHLLDNALKAHHLYKRDVNYVVKEDKVIIVDEFTGRLMDGRQWSDGLHQSVEAKEGVKIKEETQTLATVTLQNFFKLYNKLCGMTGTAMTEAGEFWKIYKLDVVAIPTNRSLQRIENPDVIYRTEREKYSAVADEIERMNKLDVVQLTDGSEIAGTLVKEDETQIVVQPQESKNKEAIERAKIKALHKKGRPILVGTVSIEKSERLSHLLEQRGVPHQVLNAKHHRREAEIIAQAGRIGAVTIATNMAGRGTDIILGGNPETMAWALLQDKYPTRLEVPRAEWDALIAEIEAREKMKEEGRYVKELGGLHVIGTERHEARRIDLQLRGRCGRQGDPGSSRFYLSLEDDLMRIFAGPWVKNILDRLGMQEGEAIESRLVSRRIEGAQKKVEERHFEARKHLLEYDEVMDEQRKRVYRYRQDILDGANCRELILGMVDEQINRNVGVYLDPDFGTGSFASWSGTRLGMPEPFEARDFRGCNFEQAEQQAKQEATAATETAIFEKVDENLPEGEDESEWNWEALATFANRRYGLNLNARELKKAGREGVSELLLERAREAIAAVDLSDGKPFLEEEFGLRNLAGWMKHKFGIEVPVDELRGRDAAAVKTLLRQKARAAYEQKCAEYPVMVGLYRFSEKSGDQARLRREDFLAWAASRFEAPLSEDDVKHKQRDEMRELLVGHARKHQEQAEALHVEVKEKVAEIFGHEANGKTVRSLLGANGSLGSLSTWVKTTLGAEWQPEQIGELTRTELERKLSTAVEDRYRPEMRKMEREVLLEVVDTAWKNHLLAMDHLLSSIKLVGWAQLDSKVEYKREGMRTFDQMWHSIAERVTDLVYKIEQLDEGYVRSTFRETSARHDEAPPESEIARQQQAAIQSSGGGGGEQQAVEPIRHRGERVGRNDPCPCGSGKKYKACCLRKGGAI